MPVSSLIKGVFRGDPHVTGSSDYIDDEISCPTSMIRLLIYELINSFNFPVNTVNKFILTVFTEKLI
jgi:hypothetical protein